jgi:hypothetical protein
MGRYTFPAFNKAPMPRYLVLWNMYWQVIDCRCLEPATDLAVAMAAAIERLEAEGWQAEGSAEYGFVFIRRDTDRRLLMLTERDPFSTRSQSFSPFRSEVR